MTSTWGWRTSAASRASLLPATRWSTRTPSRRPGPGRELGHDVGQVVDAVEPLDDDPFEAQVVAPDLLHQLGVVDALDQDPARLGHPGPGADHGPAAGGGPARWPTPGRRRGRRPRPAAVAGATRCTACPPTEKEPGAFLNRFWRPVWPATTTSSPSRATSRPVKPDERWAIGRPGVASQAGKRAARRSGPSTGPPRMPPPPGWDRVVTGG